MTSTLVSSSDVESGTSSAETAVRGDTSAGKALTLLDAFCGPLSVLGVTELATRAGLPKSTAHRLLTVLVARGYVRRVGDRYCLTEHVFEMGNHVKTCRPSGIRELAMPYVGELFAQTRQTIHLAVLTGTDILYLDKVVGHDAPRSETPVGGRRPAYATALGKALLAYSDEAAVDGMRRVRFRRFTPYTIASAAQMQRCLNRVLADGYATDYEESMVGVHCVAAPIIDSRTGKAVAAISICSRRSSVKQYHHRALLRTTQQLSRLRMAER